MGTPPGGAATPWPRLGVVGAHQGPPLPPLPPTLPSYPRKKFPSSQTRVLAALGRDFSISLLSPSFLLKFEAFDLRYVTPPLLQLEFHLMKYTMSILVL